MTTGFFGGDLSKAHWTVGPDCINQRRLHRKINTGLMPSEERKKCYRLLAKHRQKWPERRKAAVAQVGKEKYFQFPKGDAKASAAAKKKAQAYARECRAKCTVPGVRFYVREGCFL